MAKQRQKLLQYQDIETQTIPDQEIGIANVVRRLYLFYEENYRMEIAGEEDAGTVVTMRLPKEVSGQITREQSDVSSIFSR